MLKSNLTMKKTVVIILNTVRYDGDSIGDDIRIEGEIFGKPFHVERRIRRGKIETFNIEIARFETDQSIISAPVTIRVIEKDLLFNDIGQVTQKMVIRTTITKSQQRIFYIEVRETKIVPGKRKAMFDIACEARIIKSSKYQYANKSITWWEKWKELRQYTYHGTTRKEDYNRYDGIIKEVVAKWNKEFCDDTLPPPEPLDPNLVKAMLYQESRMGYDRMAGINMMQVGNKGDPSLKTLRGILKEYWIHHGKLEQLKYDAQVTSVEESIIWGTRWLYHKAYENVSNVKRSWRPWKEAVKRYGPPRESYIENVWSIYEKGIKKEKNTSIKLWVAGILFIVMSTIFAYQSAQPSLAASIMRTISPEEQMDIEDIQAEYADDRSLFWSLIVGEQDWWEELRIGKKNGANIQWFRIDEKPSEQSILNVRFLQLKGFTNPILEVYGQTHVGYGSLYLYELHDDQAILFLKTPAVDFKADGAAMPENYERYGYYHCGEVFQDGILQSSYEDMNNDGFADVQLAGVADMICDDDEKEAFVATRKTEKKFIWDNSIHKYKQIE